jgi:hypothetical protein
MAVILKGSGIYLVLAFMTLGVVGCSSDGGSGDSSCGERGCKLTAADGGLGDFFGDSTAIDGGVIVVGAIGADGIETTSGAAYVYRVDGDDWVQEQKLAASDGAQGEYFGGGVAIDGNVIVVTAEFDDENGARSGSAYVFRFDGQEWLEEQKLTASDGNADDFFGGFVAVDGNVIVIDANGDDDNGPSSGSAYVYRFDGLNWNEEQKLLADDGAAGDAFGRSVALAEDVIVVGADSTDDNGSLSGSAYVYRFDGATWTQEQKLLAADREAGDRFGTSVAVVEDIILVGAYSDDEDVVDGGINFGSAYVFEFSGGLWTEEQKLTASDGDANDFFGTSVAIDGGVIVVGADTEGENGFRSGAAYVYRRLDGLDWTENDKLTASDGDNDDRFGHSVDVNGDVAVVGAYLDENDGSSQGSAYAFEL